LWDERDPESLRLFGEFPGGGLGRRGSLFAHDARLFDLKSRSLKPLISLKVTQRAVVLTFDLPQAEKKGINITSTDSVVEVEAKLKKPASVRVGWTVQKYVRIEYYKAMVELPRTVKSDEATATFRNGLLTVKFPLAGSGTKVNIH
jgi:HSP20 family molecular chaperone IbpA